MDNSDNTLIRKSKIHSTIYRSFVIRESHRAPDPNRDTLHSPVSSDKFHILTLVIPWGTKIVNAICNKIVSIFI